MTFISLLLYNNVIVKGITMIQISKLVGKVQLQLSFPLPVRCDSDTLSKCSVLWKLFIHGGEDEYGTKSMGCRMGSDGAVSPAAA
ncbi:hypothetical protein J28TS4_10120 [Paenibacillus lautus]|nr:hypothetical protein J28TS4_10120 [Paenibacillus lautus]